MRMAQKEKKRRLCVGCHQTVTAHASFNSLQLGAVTVLVILAASTPAPARAESKPMRGAEAVRVVGEATSGRLKGSSGEVWDNNCGQKVSYSADVIDLNGDGQPEVILTRSSSCYGNVGSHLDLLVKKNGKWTAHLGFGGIYKILQTKSKGFPDIEIGGPGFCSPVWRWNGETYAIYKRCP